MRVLISAFACTPNWGSEPGVGWNWAASLSKKCKVTVITRPIYQDGLDNKKIIEDFLSENEYDIDFIYYMLPNCFSFLHNPKFIHIYSYLWQIGLYFYVKRNIDLDSFDILHHVTHNEFRNPGLLWKLKKPFVLGPIGGGTLHPEGFDEIYSSKLYKEKVRDYINRIFSRSVFIKHAIENSEYVFVADKSTMKILPKEYKEKYIKLLETGINVNLRETSVIQKEENNPINLMWAGNLIPRKGLILLIKALKKVNINYTLMILGDGPEKESLQQYIDKNGIKNVEFLGRLPYVEVQKEYCKADVFVFTSVRDTSGNVVLEAMYNRLPIVCLDHNGVSDIVTQECGIKINPGNYEQVINDLSHAIEYLDKNRSKMREMGEKAYDRILEVYDWEKKADVMYGYYQSIMKNRL